MSTQLSYEKAIKEFSKRVAKRLGRRLHSIVLYGSVVRGEATKDSDIDVLLVVKGGGRGVVEKEILEISYDVDYKNRFETFIVPIYMTPEEIEKEIGSGSYFIKNVLTQGVVLYDNGTFGRIRKEAS